MIVGFHPKALADIEQAEAYYRDKLPSLGLRFISDLEEALGRVQKQPFLYRIVMPSIRKCRLKHFPYALLYREQTQHIQIVAVIHLRKDPSSWLSGVHEPSSSYITLANG